MREMKDSGVDWIGEIPVDWTVSRLKYLGSEKTEKKYPETSDIYLGLENIVPFSNKLCESSLELDQKISQKSFCSGNVLFGKLRPYLGKTHLADFDGICSSEFFVFEPKNIASDFLRYYLLSPKTIDAINMSTYGAKMPRVSSEYLCNLQIALPNQEKQNEIVNYLNEKCQKIETSILKHKSIIEKLEEYKKSVITQAVTKGLDPNVEMKDSGVDWIGEIPAEWKIISLKHLLISPLQYGSNSAGVAYSEHLPRYIRITDIDKNGCLKSENMQSLPLDNNLQYILHEGNVLFARSGATVGKTYLVKKDDEGNLFAGYLIRAALNDKLVVPKYCYYFTQSTAYDNWKESIYIQSTIQNIGADKYKDIKISLPSTRLEQKKIVEYIDVICSSIDDGIHRHSCLIEKLEEYKKSLIYNAVTGKIDCRSCTAVDGRP